MAMTDTLGRLGATLLSMVQTRLELVAIEMEEESRRLLGYFALVLLSLVLFGIAMLLVSLTIILVFWDTYRIQAALGLALLFGAAAVVASMTLRASFAKRPRLLSATVGELNTDINFSRHAGSEE